MSPTSVSTRDPSDMIEGPYAWMRLAVSLLLAAIGGVGLWSGVVVLPAVQAEFGVDRADASLTYTITMLGFAAGNVLFGYAADRWGYWRPAVVASLMLAAGFGLASVTTSIIQFTLVHGLLIGMGSSAIFGPLIADISHWFSRRRGIAVSIAACGNYIAGAFWPLVMPYLMDGSNWRVHLCGHRHGLPGRDGAAGAAAEAPGAATWPRPRQTAAYCRSRLSPAALQTLLVIAGVGCCAAMSMPQVHLVAYCMDLGYGIARGGEMLSIMLAAGVVSRLVSGFLADRIGGIRTQLVGSALQCVALFLYIPFDGLAALYIVSLVFGLAQGGIVPAYAMIVREYMPPAEAGRRVGIVMMATTLGMALGGWMSGWIYDLTGSYTAAFMNGIAWNLLNLLVMMVILWRSTRLVEGGRPSLA